VSTRFIPGLELSRAFYREAVRPVVGAVLAGRPHSAALIGPGSDVLGFDTARSTDHDWGPRVLLFLRPEDRARLGATLHEALSARLPAAFAGYPTNFGPPGERVQSMVAASGEKINHRVVIGDLDGWFAERLGFDPRAGVALFDWLSAKTQTLAECTGGAVFHDGLGALVPARERLRWYPDDVWRYVLACQWRRIGEEEPFVGRCAEVGDDPGAAVVGARLARDLMRLQLLMHRRYPPYEKWLGTAFARVRPHGLRPPFSDLTLRRAYTDAAETHNALGLTAPLDPSTRPFHDRPFQVLDAGRFAAALLAGVADPEVLGLPAIGAIDQFADSVDLAGDPARCRAVTRAALGVASSG
jgi:hypothetical protein